MNEATKKKISKSMKKYHRCAAKHRCGRKKKTDKLRIQPAVLAHVVLILFYDTPLAPIHGEGITTCLH